ncbi:hypothetical protein COCCADRAFT_113115, partial [Bipolaris zeicola 26-R-13]
LIPRATKQLPIHPTWLLFSRLRFVLSLSEHFGNPCHGNFLSRPYLPVAS